MSYLSRGEPNQAGCAPFSAQGRRRPNSIHHSKVSVTFPDSPQSDFRCRWHSSRFRVTDSRFLLLRARGYGNQIYTSESRSTPVKKRDKLVKSSLFEVPIENSGTQDSRKIEKHELCGDNNLMEV